MTRRKNSGFGNFGGSKKQRTLGFTGDIGIAKVPSSFGQYPSKMKTGDTRHPTVVEAWNRDSQWKRWWEGWELALRSHWAWPIRKIPFDYEFDLNGTIETIGALAHLYPSLGGDSKTWYTMVRNDDSLDLTRILQTPATNFQNLGEFNDLDDGKPTVLWRATFPVKPGSSSQAVALTNLFSRIGSRRILNRFGIDRTDPLNPVPGETQEYFFSVKVWALMPNDWLNTTEMVMYFSGGILIWDNPDDPGSNGTPIGEFDPANPDHLAKIATPERMLTLGRSFSCSCPDFTKRLWFDVADPANTSDTYRAPAPTTETSSEWAERVGYFRTFGDGRLSTDDPSKWCKHIFCMCAVEGYWAPEPNDMPTSLNRQSFEDEVLKRRGKLDQKMLDAVSRYKGISADNASYTLSNIFNLEKKEDTLIPDQPWNPNDPASGFRPSWYQTVDPPPVPRPGDIWQKPGRGHIYKWQGGRWVEVPLLTGN
jgi:hypothetical protein